MYVRINKYISSLHGVITIYYYMKKQSLSAWRDMSLILRAMDFCNFQLKSTMARLGLWGPYVHVKPVIHESNYILCFLAPSSEWVSFYKDVRA